MQGGKADPGSLDPLMDPIDPEMLNSWILVESSGSCWILML